MNSYYRKGNEMPKCDLKIRIFCRHKVQVPIRISNLTLWKCQRCGKVIK